MAHVENPAPKIASGDLPSTQDDAKTSSTSAIYKPSFFSSFSAYLDTSSSNPSSGSKLNEGSKAKFLAAVNFIRDASRNLAKLPSFFKGTSKASSSNQEQNVSNVSEAQSEVAEQEPHEGDENPERGNWAHPAEFLISCIGFAVGLGNVWRFPYMCYRNGGGAFLVIYWILSATVGFPIICLEQSIGQYTSQGPLHCWQYSPVMTGVGLSMVAVSFLTVIYYDIIITWSAYYMFLSFTSELPWASCDYSSWADYRCEMQKRNCSSTFDEIKGADGLCYNATWLASYNQFGPPVSMLPPERLPERNVSTVLGFWNETLASNWGVNSLLASAQFYHNYVLGDVEPFGLENFGTPRWELVLCMIFVWVLIYLSLINGIKSSGKIVYFTCLAPYAVLLIFIVRGATLPGAYDGIRYFLTPDFERIKQPEVWYAAAGQLFYSLSACWGGMVTLASYNKFHNNIVRDALIVVFADSFTSFIASFAIFSVIGYGAYILDRPVESVVEAGTGLAFIVYPKVMTQLPGSVAFSILFFFMCILLGLDSEFNMTETVFTALLDCFPWLRKDFKTKSITFAAFCTLCFLVGLPFVCEGGPKLLNIFDNYCATWAVLLMGFLECTTICWLYGYKRFVKDLRVMMKWIPVVPAQTFAIILWGFVTPGMLAFIVFFIWVRYEPRENNSEEGLGWFLTWFVAIWMPLSVIYHLVTAKGSICERIITSFIPSHKWGPYLDKFRKEAKHLEVLRARNSFDLVPVKVERYIRRTLSIEDPEFPVPVNNSFVNEAIELSEWQKEHSDEQTDHGKEENGEAETKLAWASPSSHIVIDGKWQIQNL